MAHEPQFAPAFQKVSAHNQALLAEKLAYETAFTPAMQGLTDMAQRSKTGPRPQTALRLFVTEVRLALEAYGVKLPQWKNGRGERTDLADFCNRLLKMSGERAALISVRTMSGAPAQGFTNGIDTP